MYRTLFFAIVACLIQTTFCKQLVAGQRPNIIFLLADDQCKYSMGCYGTPNVKTPNLDQLASEGVVFERHYDTTAICMASRASILTGLYEYKHGCNFDSGNLIADHWRASYPKRLKESGYRTAFAGKFGLTVCNHPDERGRLPEEDFDRWGGGPGQTFYETRKNLSMRDYAEEFPHSTLSYAAFARDCIRDFAGQEQPFCISISFKAPHRPVQPDPKFNEVYRKVNFIQPANFGRQHGLQFSTQSRLGRQYERFHSWGYSDDYQEAMAQYYQQIYAIDVAVGTIRDALSEHQVSDNTVIIYTSDNGFLCGSHGYGSKVLPYEEASCVPLIIFDPRRRDDTSGSRCNRLTANVDIAATVLSLAELDIPKQLDGRDLMLLVDDHQRQLHPYLPLINVWGPEQVHSLGIVTEQGKYLYWPYAGDGLVATEEAYDMSEDRLELVNLIQTTEASTETTALIDQLKQHYRDALSQWNEQSVDYHGYSRFSVVFDPSVPWVAKSSLYR